MERTRDVLGVVTIDRDPTVMSIMTNVNIGFILPECNLQTKQQILFGIFVIDYIFFY